MKPGSRLDFVFVDPWSRAVNLSPGCTLESPGKLFKKYYYTSLTLKVAVYSENGHFQNSLGSSNV